MDRHQHFADELRKILRQPPFSGGPNIRPFVCNGYPLECQAFVVGLNPATATVPFFELFNSQNGRFDNKAFQAHYSRDWNRGVRPKLLRIEKSAAPVQILQTNVWCVEAARPDDVPAALRTTDLFELLLRKIRPKAMLVHGKDAAKAIARISTLQWAEEPQIGFAGQVNTSYGETIWVRIIPHLSRRGSYADAETYGMELRQKVEGRRRPAR